MSLGVRNSSTVFCSRNCVNVGGPKLICHFEGLTVNIRSSQYPNVLGIFSLFSRLQKMLARLKSRGMGAELATVFWDFYLQRKGDEHEDNLIAEKTKIKLQAIGHLLFYNPATFGSIQHCRQHTMMQTIADET